MSQPIGSCIIVLSPDKKSVLLGKRKNAYKAGWYGLPGGRIEVGERAQETAKRELTEETGLTANQTKYLGVIKENQGDYDFIHFAFVCESFSGELCVIEPEKCENWEWVPLDKLPAEILPGHMAAIEMYLNPKETSLRDF